MKQPKIHAQSAIVSLMALFTIVLFFQNCSDVAFDGLASSSLSKTDIPDGGD